MKRLSRREALRRMAAGDLPTAGGGYSSALHFDDGRRTSGQTGYRMRRDGLIESPAKTSVDATYTLTDDGRAEAGVRGKARSEMTIDDEIALKIL